MPRKLIISAAFLILSACQPGPESMQSNRPDSIDFQIMKELLDAQVDAWNRGSIDDFMKGYWESDSLLFISGNGVRKGYDKVLNAYRKNYDTREKMGKLAFEALEFRKLTDEGTAAQVSGQWKISGKENSGGHFSLVFALKKGEWKIVADHTW